MKKLFPFSLLIIILTFGISLQAAGIQGTIKDEITGAPLIGANIIIEGTNFGVSSDKSGSFSLLHIPEGKYHVVISYLGYKKKEFDVNLPASGTLVENISLEQTVLEGKSIIIEGIRQGQSLALNEQKSSDNIKNIVAADLIGRFPDPNAAEALQRIPAVSLQRDEGEGRYVMIRGLDPNFANIRINGEQIPSPEGDVRYIAIDAVPASQLASIEVDKAITPDMDGDAIGGSVNLVTPVAFYNDLSVSATLGGEYNGLVEKLGGEGALSISNRLLDGKLGYVINMSYHPSHRGSNKNEMDDWNDAGDNPPLETFELRDYEINRSRVGLSATLDYNMNKNNSFYLRSIYSDLREQENRRRTVFEYDGDDDIWEFERHLKDRPENQGVISTNLGAKHILNSFVLDYELAYSYARQYTPHDYQVIFENDPTIKSVNFNVSTPEAPEIMSIYDEDGNPFNFTNNDNYVFKEYEESETEATDQNITAKFNIDIPYTLNGYAGNVKFGGKSRFKQKDYRFLNYGLYEYEGDMDLLLTEFQGAYKTENFMDGDYDQGLLPDMGKWRSFFNSHRGDFSEDTEAAVETKAEEYEATEDVYAGYLMSKLQLDRLMVMAGVRVEYTNVDYTSYEFDADNETFYTKTGTNSYTMPLPMLHLKYSLAPNTNVRAAATMSYARPNFAAMVQGAELELSDDQVVLGNTDLKPVKAINLDLFFEHYFSNVGIISVGMFYKDLQDFIYKRTVTGTYTGINGTYDDIEITQTVNGDNANLKGFEISWQQNFSFLPGFLDGFGIYANYTYTDSEAELKDAAGYDGETVTIELPGTSEQVWNAALTYSKYGFNGRIAFNFNGAYIEEIDDDVLYGVDDHFQIDISLSQRILTNLSVYGEAININNAERHDYYNSMSTPATREIYGTWGRLGVLVDL